MGAIGTKPLTIEVTVSKKIFIPLEAKVISNDDWLTIARKNKDGNIEVLTRPVVDIADGEDLSSGNRWVPYNHQEIKEIVKTFRIKL